MARPRARQIERSVGIGAGRYHAEIAVLVGRYGFSRTTGRVLMDHQAGEHRETVVYDLTNDPGQTHPQAAADLVGAARDLIGRTPRRPPGPLVRLEADAGLAQRLRALGYVE